MIILSWFVGLAKSPFLSRLSPLTIVLLLLVVCRFCSSFCVVPFRRRDCRRCCCLDWWLLSNDELGCLLLSKFSLSSQAVLRIVSWTTPQLLINRNQTTRVITGRLDASFNFNSIDKLLRHERSGVIKTGTKRPASRLKFKFSPLLHFEELEIIK